MRFTACGVALTFSAFSLPLVLLVACSQDGKTPDCALPNAGCEPAAPNANPDAQLDGPKDGRPDTNQALDANPTGDADAASDAPRDGDALVDGDAKAG